MHTACRGSCFQSPTTPVVYSHDMGSRKLQILSELPGYVPQPMYVQIQRLVRSSVDLSRTVSEISFPATGEKTYTIHSNVPPSCDDLLISYKGALLQRAINSPIASFGVVLNQLKLLIYPRDNRVHASHNIVGIQVLKHSHSLERNTKN